MSDWGYVVNPDGSQTPLKAPEFTIAEEERDVVIDTPGLVMWTRKEVE